MDAVLILKETVPPTSTLMSVAKPWMPGSPAPLTLHTDCGVPGCAFSQGIGLTFATEQGSTARTVRTASGAFETATTATSSRSERLPTTWRGRS